jgi:hypothetical protein
MTSLSNLDTTLQANTSYTAIKIGHIFGSGLFVYNKFFFFIVINLLQTVGEAVNVAYMGETKNAHRVFIGTLNPQTPKDVYIRRTAPLTSRRCIYIFSQQIYVLNILNMLHILHSFLFKMPFVSYATFFGSCIIHNVHTGCANIKKKFRRQRVNTRG